MGDEHKSSIVKPNGNPFVVNGDGKIADAPEVDPVMVAARANWDNKAYLRECYQNFLRAVQMGVPKDYHYNSELEWITAGCPRWSVGDSFVMWVKDQLYQLHWRLDELKAKRAENRPSDRHLIHLLDSGTLSPSTRFVGYQINQEDYEVYEWILRKSLEALESFKKGDIKLEQLG